MAAFDGERGEFRFAFGVSDDGAIERARGAATATATAVPAEEIGARGVARRATRASYPMTWASAEPGNGARGGAVRRARRRARGGRR